MTLVFSYLRSFQGSREDIVDDGRIRNSSLGCIPVSTEFNEDRVPSGVFRDMMSDSEEKMYSTEFH